MNFQQRQEKLSHFKKVLERAQAKRKDKLQKIVHPVLGEVLEWHAHEMEVMFNLINSERRHQQKKTITLNELVKVERQAVGHSDYSEKFSLYCLQLLENT